MVTDLLSKPIRYGYIHGVAITVVISQLPKVLGFKSKGADIFEQSQSLLQDSSRRISTHGRSHWIGDTGLDHRFRRWFPRVPGILLAAVLAIVVVRVWKLDLYSQLAVVWSSSTRVAQTRMAYGDSLRCARLTSKPPLPLHWFRLRT